MEGLEVLSGLVKGQVVIVDDTVDHDALGRCEPLRTTGPAATPTGGSRGPSSSRSPWLTSGRTFMVGAFPYGMRKMLDLGMVTEFKTKIDLAREMLDVLKERFRVSMVFFDSSTGQRSS